MIAIFRQFSHAFSRFVIVGLVFCNVVVASPLIATGDLALRHDIQRLADAGIISGPVSSWPLAWGPVLSNIAKVDNPGSFPADVQDALARIRARSAWETGVGEIRWRARLAAGNPSQIRSFQNTPREDGEISAGANWTGERFTIDLNATFAADPLDDREIRADGSHVGIAIGNFTFAASTMDRWWGPAWDSSLILSSNARPIPALTMDRNFTQPFESKWLSWIGPWDMSFIWGQLESARTVPDAQFLGFRINMRPLHSLEIGLSRSAQWCGDGRPCDLDTLWNLIIGNDNVGDDGITSSTEPGNQTAALDIRWTMYSLGLPLAVYGQFMAEDEAGGFPSRYMGQFGIEGTGYWRNNWSYRWYGEHAVTTCDFIKSDKMYNCAYNHGIYKDGYRYRHRSIGHAADNDATVTTLGLVLVDDTENSWQGYVRFGTLNDGGVPDPANSLSAFPQDIVNIELIHNRVFNFGRVEFGLGYEHFDENPALQSSNEARAFIQWRSDY